MAAQPRRDARAGDLGPLLLATLIGTGGCSGSPAGSADLTLDAIEPAIAMATARTAVEITGTGFHVPVQVSLDNDTLDTEPIQITLGGVDLEEIVLLDMTRITAFVPNDLPVGSHDLEITLPDNDSAELTAAFEVLAPITATLATEPEINAGGEVILTLSVVSLADTTLAIGLDGPVVTAPTGVLSSGALGLAGDLTAGATDGATTSLQEILGASTDQTVDLSVGVTWLYGTLGGTVQASTSITVLAGNPCTDATDCVDPCRSVASCDGGECVFGAIDKDSDDDGYLDLACGGDDCDDGNGTAFPGQTWYADCDNDGFFSDTAVTSCEEPATDCTDGLTPDGGWTNADPGAGADCDDEDETLNPDTVWYADTDTDGYGDPAVSVIGCTPPADHVANDLDCDDAGPCGAACSPDVSESTGDANCDDGLDNDCNGSKDAAEVGCGAGNTAPVPALVISPPTGDLTTEFFADATGTWDREDMNPADLTYDWDWENDGTFDVTDDPAPAAPFGFSSAGTFTVVLRVTDTGGASAYGLFAVVVVADPANVITVTTGAASGAGSLTDAIAQSNASPERETVIIPTGTVVTLDASLTFTDPVDLVGDGAVIDGGGLVVNCVVPNTGSDGSGFYGLEITGCTGVGLRAQAASNHTVSRCFIHDNDIGISLQSEGNTIGPDNEISANASIGVQVNALTNAVRANRIHHNLGSGIQIVGGGDGTIIDLNFLYANVTGIELGSNADATLIRHNTIFQNTGAGLSTVANADSTDCRNNIFAHNGTTGISGDDDNFGAGLLDYNAYFANGTGSDHCDGCTTLGANSLVDTDPVFVDLDSPDLRLVPGTSPLIDQGLDLGVDVNGPLPVPPYPPPELYNGAAPDIGAAETP